jgi:hypothetical protein
MQLKYSPQVQPQALRECWGTTTGFLSEQNLYETWMVKTWENIHQYSSYYYEMRFKRFKPFEHVLTTRNDQSVRTAT